MKAQETEDAELVALAAMVFSEAIAVQAANMDRERRGLAMAYGEDTPPSKAELALSATLKLRGVLP